MPISAQVNIIWCVFAYCTTDDPCQRVVPNIKILFPHKVQAHLYEEILFPTDRLIWTGVFGLDQHSSVVLFHICSYVEPRSVCVKQHIAAWRHRQWGETMEEERSSGSIDCTASVFISCLARCLLQLPQWPTTPTRTHTQVLSVLPGLERGSAH